MPRLTDFQRIVSMNALAGIGMGLVGIFIPIYLLESGFSISQAIIWLLVHHTTIIFGAFLSAYASNKIGLVQCWYVRIFLAIVLFCGLITLPSHPSLLYLIAIVSGLESAFFWIPYNIFTVRKTEDKNIGSSLAFMQNVSTIAGIFVPLIAAYLIVSFGFNILFVVALVFLILSIIPVFPLRHEKADFTFSLERIKDTVKENKHFIIPEVLDNLGQDAQVIWSMFIFITALTIIDIGVLGVLASIVGMFINHTTGKLIDTWDRRSIIRFGAIATTLMWLASYIVAVVSPTPVLLYVVTVLRGFVLGIFASSYGAIMLNQARGKTGIHFLVMREIPTVLGRIGVFLISLFLISIGRFEMTFLIVAILSLYFWFNDLNVLTKKS